MAKDYNPVIGWINNNYSPANFGISEDELKEKIIQDGRYTLDYEVGEVINVLLDENPKFSVKLIEKAYTREEIIKRFVTSDFDRLKEEAKGERTRLQQARSRAKREEQIAQGKNPDF